MELRLHYLLSALVALSLVAAAPAATKPPQVIKQFPLDERTVYEIPIGSDVPTTLMFPSALTAIEGANISAAPDTPAPVLLAYTPGRYFFSVRAQDENAKAAVNVIWKNRTFVIRFFTSKEENRQRAFLTMARTEAVKETVKSTQGAAAERRLRAAHEMSENWHRANELRAFRDACRTGFSVGGGDAGAAPQEQAWMDWLDRMIANTDPLLSGAVCQAVEELAAESTSAAPKSERS